MQCNVIVNGKRMRADLTDPIDLSIPIPRSGGRPRAFGLPPTRYETYRSPAFVGSVARGGSCNCEAITIHPHTVTHTECCGHLMKKIFPIGSALKRFHFPARLVSIRPASVAGDRIITARQLRETARQGMPEALIVRTPDIGRHPPYLHAEGARFLRQSGVRHLLVDLPSVDRVDDKRLTAHRAFWDFPRRPRYDATITELISVPNGIKDGLYLLNLQIIGLDSDASPSKPVIYRLQ